MNKDSLGDRMKGYENIPRIYLTRRMPAIIRIDGKAFHTFTRGFDRPFDEIMIRSMWETAKYLCENIQGCKLAYTQSDEISLLLTDYDELTTSAWFDKNIQKIVSVSASMATLAFNKYFSSLCIDWYAQHNASIKEWDLYSKRFDTALFDSRVFIIPKEDVCNYFIWRQQDATRNAIQMVGYANFSHKQLNNVNCNQIQEKLFQEKSINFNDYPISQKRGICVVKEYYKKDEADRSRWVIDENIPVFTQDREYIEKFI
jgi:tRNA(His) 5'-end guanylyltransferase